MNTQRPFIRTVLLIATLAGITALLSGCCWDWGYCGGGWHGGGHWHGGGGWHGGGWHCR